MSLQQRYQRLGRNDSWSASLRDTVLLVFGLPVALGLAGMLVASKEMSPEQTAAQAARQARRATLTARRRVEPMNVAGDEQPPPRRTRNIVSADQPMMEEEPEPEMITDQQPTPTRTTRRTVW
jgi:hypothetical protein